MSSEIIDIPLEDSEVLEGQVESSKARTPLKAAAHESENVGVMIRIRPFNRTELSLGDGDSAGPTGTSSPRTMMSNKPKSDDQPKKVTSIVYVKDNTTVSILDPVNIESGAVKESFIYDRVFWSMPPEAKQASHNTEFATQETVFEHIGLPVVDACLKGRNSCVFAYGQTGSGKTHTMIGAPGDEGLIPRVINHLFDNGGQPIPSYIERTIHASFLEIYNEKVKDLLEADDLNKKGVKSTQGYADRKVRYNPEMGTYIEGLRRVQVSTPEECDQVITAGTSTRTVAATQMNDTSSRSHAILQLHVKQKDTHLGIQRSSILNLVDLAGSERIKMSGVSGTQLSEAKNINLSLTCLRRVIDTLLDNAKNPKAKKVAPYRESMLTWVLSDSLGGNCRTTMLGTVSPHARNFEDTVNTLRYALKAKAISCTVKINEEKCTVVVNALKNEMDKMKKKLAAAHAESGGDEPGSAPRISSREREMKEKEELAQADAKASLESKEHLRRQVTMSQVALRKAQSDLFKKTEMAEQTRIIEEELAKAATFKARAAEMIEEDKVLEETFRVELEEASALEKDIEVIQVLQSKREDEAKAAKEKEQRDTATLLFRCATRFGKDRKEMATMGRHIAKLNIKNTQLKEHYIRTTEKVERAYSDVQQLRKCVHTGEVRTREQEQDSTTCIQLRADRIKSMFESLYSSRNMAQRLKGEVSNQVEDEIQRHHNELLPVHVAGLERASKDTGATETELKQEEDRLDREAEKLIQELGNLQQACQVAVGTREDATALTSELQLVAVDRQQSVLLLERQVLLLEEETMRLDADNAATSAQLQDSNQRLEAAITVLDVDTPNHDSLKTLLRQESVASSGGAAAANGRGGHTMYRSQSSLGVDCNGGGDTPRGGHSRTTIQQVLKRSGMNFSASSGQQANRDQSLSSGVVNAATTTPPRSPNSSAVKTTPANRIFSSGTSRTTRGASTAEQSAASPKFSAHRRRSVSPNITSEHSPGPFTRRVLKQVGTPTGSPKYGA